MSFSIATSGLDAFSKQLGAISNNIANSNTAGYKSMRAEFASLYGGGQPQGVNVSDISQSVGQSGTVTNTSRALDLAITGKGFFVSKDENGATTYSRAGYMALDAEGKLVNNLGARLQGYSTDDSGALQTGALGDLQVKVGAIPAQATDKLGFVANLDAGAIPPVVSRFSRDDPQSYNNVFSSRVYDSLGQPHSVEQYFAKTGEGSWDVHFFVDGATASPAKTQLRFDNSGNLLPSTTTPQLTSRLNGVDPLAITVDYSGTSQYSSSFNVMNNTSNGYAAGEMVSEQIDDDGKIYATYTNGERLLQGQLVLANFRNPQALKSEDGTAWSEANGSGQPLYGTPKSGMNGSIKAFALESSNVDLTSELVGLMGAQRSYQANTKVISTNDAMMNALFQAL